MRWCERTDTGGAPSRLGGKRRRRAYERQKVSGRLQGDPLAAALAARFGGLRPGEPLTIGGRRFEVARVVTLDGWKVVLDTGWWFGVRASGTEPVARPYVETFAAPGAPAAARTEAADWQRRILGWLREEIAAVVG